MMIPIDKNNIDIVVEAMQDWEDGDYDSEEHCYEKFATDILSKLSIPKQQSWNEEKIRKIMMENLGDVIMVRPADTTNDAPLLDVYNKINKAVSQLSALDKSVDRDRVIGVLSDFDVVPTVRYEYHHGKDLGKYYKEVADAICKEPLKDNDKVIAENKEYYHCVKCGKEHKFDVVNLNGDSCVGFRRCPFCGADGFNIGHNEFSMTNKII